MSDEAQQLRSALERGIPPGGTPFVFKVLASLEFQNQALKGLLQEWLDDFDAYPSSPDLEYRTRNALSPTQETDPR